MTEEHQIIPYHCSPPQGERIIVLAPHPDDETLGCGGTLRLLVEAGKKILVIFITSGDKADPANPKSSVMLGEAHVTEYSLLREKEAKRALRILGVTDYKFLRFPDREVQNGYQIIIGRLLEAVETFMPDAVYAPSLVEVNPDHRAAAALAMDIQKACIRGDTAVGNPPHVEVVFYEVTTPLRPNILVDITSVYSTKKSAAKKYKSQLKVKDYLRHITALNTVRALTTDGPRYVEAFWSIDRPLSDDEIRDRLAFRKSV